MTYKLWNKLINNLDKMACIVCNDRQSFYLDGTFSTIMTDFKMSVDKENELLTIKFIHPHCLNEDKWFSTGKVEYIDIPDQRTFHRTQLRTFKWRK